MSGDQLPAAVALNKHIREPVAYNDLAICILIRRSDEPGYNCCFAVNADVHLARYVRNEPRLTDRFVETCDVLGLSCHSAAGIDENKLVRLNAFEKSFVSPNVCVADIALDLDELCLDSSWTGV